MKILCKRFYNNFGKISAQTLMYQVFALRFGFKYDLSREGAVCRNFLMK